MNQLDEIVKKVVGARFPGVDLDVRERFRPMLNLDRGVVSSSVALKVASTTRRGASEVADELVSALSGHFPLPLRNDGGYLVVQLSSPLALVPYLGGHPAAAGAIPMAPQRVVGAYHSDAVPAYARLRIISLAALHAAVARSLGAPVELAFGAEPVPVHGWKEISRAVAFATRDCLSSTSSGTSLPLDAVTDGPAATLWIAHHHAERLPKPQRQSLDAARRAGRTSVRMPNDGWLMSRQRALPELLEPRALARVAERVSGVDGWARWVFHQSSSIPSQELDPAVALFNELASPLFGLRALVERVGIISGRRMPDPSKVHLNIRDETRPPPAGRLGVLVAQGQVRMLVARALLLPWWALWVARSGEVEAWSGVVGELVGAGHRVLNAPELARYTALREQIVASLEFGLSGILGVVTEDAWADQ